MITVIHNLYKRNPYVRESVGINLKALEASKVDYQYICFNDCGDLEIKEDLKDLLDKVDYIYSPTNFGQKMCSGGWVGALPHVKGDFIHNTGQDDVFTPNFYREMLSVFKTDPTVMLAFSNCIMTNHNLVPEKVFLPLSPQPIYDKPFDAFKTWFGVGANGRNEPTRANNFIAAPGVIYRKNLHKIIGEPDLTNFLGSADFEYWARVLFYGHKVKYIHLPLWLYRISNFSTTNVTENCATRTENWNEKILQKYKTLYTMINNVMPL